MTSSVLDSHLNTLSDGPPDTVQPELPQSVDLLLRTRPPYLLRLIHSLDLPPDVQDEYFGIQIQRLLQLAWIVAVRAFASCTTLYVGAQYSQGRCFVGETNNAAAMPTTQIHVDAQDLVLDLFEQLISGLNGLPSKEPADKSTRIKENHELNFNTFIEYQRQLMSNGTKGRSCTGGCLACCPAPKTEFMMAESMALDLLPGGLRLLVTQTPDNRLHAQLELNSGQVQVPLARSLLHSFDQALTCLAIQFSQPVSCVDLCSSHDRSLIAEFTRKVAPAQEALVHDLCLRHVQTTPDAPAVRSWDGDLTYKELTDLTSRLAHWLVRKGVIPGVFVGCAFYKSTWAIVARLAVLMAGGAYLCVDAHDPPSYLDSVMERTNIKILLTSVGFSARFADCVDTTLEISEASLQELPALSGVPCKDVTPTDPCVVLFTSGSTGKPKGIVQEHRSYASALTDYIRVMGMGPHTRLFQFDAYAFDISNNDFMAPLMAGGCCCVPTTSLTMEALVLDLNDLKANMMFVTPSVAIDVEPDHVPTLQTMCIGGEPVSDAVVAKWMKRVRLINQYGMGEVASLCAYNPELQMGRGAVVGRPATGAIWIVNPDSPDQLMPVGAVGELLIEGPHISRGYLDHVSGKSENFLIDPPVWRMQMHVDQPTYRFYRSGDLGRYNHDGLIEFLGRKDTMLKLDGARIEAGQVEHVLRQHLSPAEAAVVDVLGSVDGISDPILGVYLFLANNPMNLERGPVEDMQFRAICERHAIHTLTQTLNDAVRQSLPPYYIPSLYLLIDRVPRTKSHKTDRRKLHMLGQEYYMAHREELREVTTWPKWD